MGSVLKVKLFQPTGVYRNPISMGVIETYPLPPPSTVIGWLVHNLIFSEWEVDQDYFEEWNRRIQELREGGFNLSIQGNYEGILRDYQHYIQFKEVPRRPFVVSTLMNINLTLHLKAKPEMLKKLEEIIKQPPSIPCLGRAEDICKILSVKPVKVELNRKSDFDLKTAAIIPYFNPLIEEFFPHRGIPLRLTTWCNWLKLDSFRIRNFEREDYAYVEEALIEEEVEILEDEDGEPVWWCMPSRAERP